MNGLGASNGGRRLVGAGAARCLILLALTLAALPAGVRARAEPMGIGLIPTESGVGDLSFNWMAHQGLLRAEADFGIVGTVYTPADPGDYAAQIQQCVDDGNLLCLTVGFGLADATWEAAQNNPVTHFAIADYTWESYPDNLRGTTFAVEQVGYMAGTLAARMSESKVVSAVGGMEIPTVVAFLDPYRNGAQCALPGVSVIVEYAGTFTDPDLGAQMAQAQMSQGADVVFGCGGMTGNGAILWATQQGAWGVGVDSDQWTSLFESGVVPGSDRLLTSAMKRIDNAVYATIADEVSGAFSPGTALYDLATDGVGLAPYHEADPSIPQEAKDAVEAVRLRLLEGSIDPWQPCTWNQSFLPLVARSYTPPNLTLWHNWGGEYFQEYLRVVGSWNGEHPEMALRLVRQDDMHAALAAAVPVGEGPDIVAYANDPIGEWSTAGYLEALDAWIDLGYLEDNFEPAAAQAMQWDGQIWGIPESQEGIALVYNTALVGEPELPAPDDWAGLLALADQFQQGHPGRTYLCNQGLGGTDAYHAAPIYFGHGMSQYGGYVDEEGNAYMDTAEALAAAEWIAEMSAFGPAQTSHQICRDMLVNGEAAIWWTGPWAIADLQQAGIDYGIVPMGRPFVGIKNLMLTTNAVERGNDDAAVAFMQFLGSAETQVRLALANRTIPANTAALNDPDVQALYEVARFGMALNQGVAMGSHPYITCQWVPVGEATWAIWSGSQAPVEAMAAAQAAIEACVAGMGPAPR